MVIGLFSDIPIAASYFIWRYISLSASDFDRIIRRNVPYDEDNHAALLDLYLPSTKASSSSPIVVFIYGGSWSSGGKTMYTTMANTLRELGYIVVLPDYRKYPEVKAEAMYHDVRKAIRWAYTHAHEFNGDTEQIHVMGHSAGAQLASQTVLMDVVRFIRTNDKQLQKVKRTENGLRENGDLNTSAHSALPRIEGLILLAGVYNIGGHLEHETYRGVEKISAMARAMGSNQESFKKNSPINIIRENKDMFEHSSALISHMPRILFIHGEKDAVVPVQQSIDMYNALGEVLPPEKRDDVDVRMRLYKKMGHAECVTALMPNLMGRSRFRKSLAHDIREFIELPPYSEE
ncbi:Alpha/Beta hydrolase protein [Umbelopsis sp. PMI_123]|nr:Alpha/Beta hydrolase protein [Umbelopsis sp. PMI_123]